MAKSNPQAEAAAEVEVPAAEAEQPAAEPVEVEAGDVEQPQADEPEAVEAEVDAPAEPLPTHVLMKHPGGGSCDQYVADAEGFIEVLIHDIETMISHGFEVVARAL